MFLGDIDDIGPGSHRCKDFLSRGIGLQIGFQPMLASTIPAGSVWVLLLDIPQGQWNVSFHYSCH